MEKGTNEYNTRSKTSPNWGAVKKIVSSKTISMDIKIQISMFKVKCLTYAHKKSLANYELISPIISYPL